MNAYAVSSILTRSRHIWGHFGGIVSRHWGHRVLTELECKRAAARDRPYKMGDRQSLFLYVTTTGYKSWRWKYRFDGKAKQLVFGPYPEVTLKQARLLRDEAAAKLRSGLDPMSTKRVQISSQVPTFEAIGRLWHANQAGLWVSKHASTVMAGLVAEIFPVIGHKPVDEITASDVRNILLTVQSRGAVDTAHRLRARISAIFELSIASGWIATNPASSIAAVLKPVRKRMMPAVGSLTAARNVLKHLEAAPAHPATKLASRMLAITAVRPGMIRFAERIEFENLDSSTEALWRIPATKMKLLLELKDSEAFDFLVPLSRQAVAIFQAALALSANSPYLFPSTRFSHRPMSENGLNAYYRRVYQTAGKHVPHGWRSTFSTVMNDRAMALDRPGDRPIIDLMLAHKPQGVESRYNRAAYMPRRRELAQTWADLLLEGFCPPADLIEGPRR